MFIKVRKAIYSIDVGQKDKYALININEISLVYKPLADNVVIEMNNKERLKVYETVDEIHRKIIEQLNKR